jgi:hypothetical protein
MNLVVVLEPSGQVCQDSQGVRPVMDIDVIAFEGFYERLGHTVGLRAAHRREAGNQTQAYSELDRLVSPVAAAIVGEPLDGVWRKSGTTPFLDGLEHQVPDHLTADTTGIGAPGHDLPIAGIKRKSDSDYLTVPARDFKARALDQAASQCISAAAVRCGP